MSGEIYAVTGAFGYSGSFIAKRLLGAGRKVRTLTNSSSRENPFGERIEVFPLNFDNPENLAEALRGVKVLYNNYWVRFNYPGFTHEEAVKNTFTLFKAAAEAGVKRVVHISITNPSEDSPLEYFSGKARIEKALKESGLSYAILRPAVLFGGEDILINNIAWFLRSFPVFGVFGCGDYKLQPIHVEDLAELAVEQGDKTDNAVIDAIGPETFTYRGLIEEIGKAIGTPRLIIPVPPLVGYAAGRFVGALFSDVTITRDEITGLMAGLLCTDSPPAGKTKLTEWIKQNADTLGKRYHSELARRRDRITPYEKL